MATTLIYGYSKLQSLLMTVHFSRAQMTDLLLKITGSYEEEKNSTKLF